MSKRFLSLVLALVMVLGTLGTTVFADEPTAVAVNEKIQWLIDQGIVTGNESGELMLDKTIDRASVAKMVVEALDLKAVAAGMRNYKAAFNDVPVTHWSNGNINVVAGRGLMIGNAGNFMPANQISYAEVVTILVRMLEGLTADEEKTAVWPTTYIAKAYEMGLLDGVTVTSYQEPAVREAILEMFYNAMINRQVGNYTIVKGIVLENYRVETLNKDEIVIEVIQEVQRAEFAKENRKGDQLSLVISAKVADVEDLLGKVADFTLDKDGKVVAVKVDDSYKYEVGALSAIDDALVIAGKEYTVVKDERYEQRDDRVFRTYVDNKSYQYSKYATGTKYADAKKAEFARVTTKHGKVLFIDAFNFDDIAPVKEVRSDGKIVYIYDDLRNGSEKRVDFNARTKVVSIKGKVMNVASLDDIDVFDVIHYNETSNTVFVREDAKVEGAYEKYATSKIDDQSIIRIYVDGEEYVAGFGTKRTAVFTINGEDFLTLSRGIVSENLRKIAKKDVVLLLDMNNRVQYIGSDIVDPSFVALVVDTLRGEVRFAKADGTEVDLRATFDTDITIDGSTKQQNINILNAGDLVKVIASDDDLVAVTLLASANDIEEGAKKVTKITRDYVVIDGSRVYLSNRTNIFDFDELEGMDIATLLDVFENNAGKAFVKDDTIVFMELEAKPGQTSSTVVRVLDIFGSGNNWQLEVENNKNEISEHKISKANASKVEEGDIVKVTLTKNDDKNITAIDVLIEADAEVFEVSKFDRYNIITLIDKNGKDAKFLVLRSAAIFGDLGVSEYVSFKAIDGDIVAIEVRDNRNYDMGDLYPVDKTTLVEALEEALAVDTELYTVETVAALQKAIADAQALEADATQEEVDAAVEALKLAIENLVVAPGEPEVLTLKLVQADAVDETMSIFGVYSVSIKFENAEAKLEVTEESVLTLTLEDGTVIELAYDGDTLSFANWDIQGVESAEVLYNGVVAVK